MSEVPPVSAEPAEAAEADPVRSPSEVLRRHRTLVAALIVVAAPVPALRAGWSAELAPALSAVLFGVPLAVIDAATRRLPNAWLAAWLAGLAPALAGAAAAGHTALAERAVFAGLLVAGCYFVLYVVTLSRGGVGMGDVKLMVLVGATLGARSWGAVLYGLMAGSLFAAAAVPWMLRTGRRDVPYGPFMLAGTVLALAVAVGSTG